MLFNGLEIPNELVDASLQGDLVIFAGAGVSMQEPVKFPSFDELVDKIRDKVDFGHRRRDRRGKKEPSGKIEYSEPAEQYLDSLQQVSQESIHGVCSQLLSTSKTTALHEAILDLFSDRANIRIVTTNFDTCFENALAPDFRGVFSAPALPLGENFKGIVHLHGIVNEPENMVLTSTDYGKAYITNGWASRFLVDVFRSYTVLFIGYKYGDSLVDYLTRGISQNVKAYVMIKDTSNDEELWRSRNIQTITFSDYNVLAPTIKKWAAYRHMELEERVGYVKELASRKELSSQELEGLRYVFTTTAQEVDSVTCTRIFCENSTQFSHLELFKKWDFLDFLTKGAPKEKDRFLLEWAVRNLALSDYKRFQDFIGENCIQLSTSFYNGLLFYLAVNDYPDEVVGAWIVWIKSSDYLRIRDLPIYLLEIANKKSENPDIICSIAEILLSVFPFYSHFYSRPVPELVLRKHQFEKFVKILYPSMAVLEKRIFYHCFQQIENAYRIQTQCWTKSAFDLISFSRSSIATHEQDIHNKGATDSLLEIAKECVNDSFADVAVEDCLNSKCALLVRLGLWILCQKEDVGDEGLELIMEQDFLQKTELHHEVFHLMKKSFWKASENEQKAFIAYLRDILSRKLDDKSQEKRSSYYWCYNICVWLMVNRKENSQLVTLRDEILDKNPDFLPREHPDFTHYWTSAPAGLKNRYEVSRDDFNLENIVARLSGDDVNTSDSVKRDIVAVPTKEYPDIAFRMISSLIDKNDRTIPENLLLCLLVETIEWGKIREDVQSLADIFSRLFCDADSSIVAISSIQRYLRQGDSVCESWSYGQLASVLRAFSNYDLLFSQKLSLRSDEEEPDWVLQCINHPVGELIDLVEKLGGLTKTQNEKDSFNDLVTNFFEDIEGFLYPEVPAAYCVFTRFFMGINFWLDIAPDFLEKKILPALKPNDPFAIAAWQGLATVGSACSVEIWKNEEYWRALFDRRIGIKDAMCNRHLVSLYISSLLHYESGASDRKTKFLLCALGSQEFCESAYWSLDFIFNNFTSFDRGGEWDAWLDSASKVIAAQRDYGKQILAQYYIRWFSSFPELRTELVQAIQRDCQGVRDISLYIEDELWEEILCEDTISADDKARVFVFILENEPRFFLHKEKVSQAITSLLCSEVLALSLKQRLKNICVREGIVLEKK